MHLSGDAASAGELLATDAGDPGNDTEQAGAPETPLAVYDEAA